MPLDKEYKEGGFTIKYFTCDKQEELDNITKEIYDYAMQLKNNEGDIPDEILIVKYTNRTIVRPTESNITDEMKKSEVWYSDIPTPGEAAYFTPDDVYYIRILHHKGHHVLADCIKATLMSIVGDSPLLGQGEEFVYGCGNDLIINGKKFFGDAKVQSGYKVMEISMHTFYYDDDLFKSDLGPDFALNYEITGIENEFGKIDREEYWRRFIQCVINKPVLEPNLPVVEKST